MQVEKWYQTDRVTGYLFKCLDGDYSLVISHLRRPQMKIYLEKFLDRDIDFIEDLGRILMRKSGLSKLELEKKGVYSPKDFLNYINTESMNYEVSSYPLEYLKRRHFRGIRRIFNGKNKKIYVR